MQDPKNREKFAIWEPSHNFIGLCLRNYKAHIENRKKNFLNSNISPTCPYSMVKFGPLAAEIVWLVSGTQQISTAFASWQRYCMALW